MIDTESFKDCKELSSEILFLTTRNDEVFLNFKKSGLLVRVKKGGYIPRSGLLFIDCLNKVDLHGKILDIGTGETGLLAHYAHQRKVDAVYACDEDMFAIKHAKHSSSVSDDIN